MHPVIFEVVLFVILVFIVGTQIIWPATRNQPLWPFFRARKALSQLDDAKAEVLVSRIKAEAKRLQRHRSGIEEE